MSKSNLSDNISEAGYMDTGSTYTDDCLYSGVRYTDILVTAARYEITQYKENVYIQFDGKPERRVRAKLMRDGFRWISSRRKWCKKCTIDKEETLKSLNKY